MARLPIFAAGDLKVIQPAIEAGTLSYPAYVFVRDEHKLGFVDKDNELILILGDNKKQVLNVEELPDVASGDKEVLYVYNGVVYVFDGEKYIPSYKDHTSELEALTARIETLEEKVSAIESSGGGSGGGSTTDAETLERITELEGKVTTLETEIETLNTTVEEIQTGFTFVELE